MIQAKCPNCGKTLNVRDDYAGKKGKCPACSNVFVIQPAEPDVSDLQGLLGGAAASAPLPSAATPKSPLPAQKPQQSVKQPRSRGLQGPLKWVIVGALVAIIAGAGVVIAKKLVGTVPEETISGPIGILPPDSPTPQAARPRTATSPKATPSPTAASPRPSKTPTPSVTPSPAATTTAPDSTKATVEVTNTIKLPSPQAYIICVSPDGKKVVYREENKIGLAGEGAYDAQAVPRWEKFHVKGGSFTSDGKHWYCTIETSSGEPMSAVLLDGQVKWTYPKIYGLKLSPDGSHVAFMATGSDKLQHFVLDGQESKGYASLNSKMADPFERENAVKTFSPDSKRTAYLFEDSSGKTGLNVDGKDFAVSSFDMMSWSGDGKHFGYISGEECFIDGEKKFSAAGYVKSMVLNESGDHFACVEISKDMKKSRVIIDGVGGDTFNLVDSKSLHFISEGNVSYRAQHGGDPAWVVMVGEKDKHTLWKGPGSPGSRRHAYILQRSSSSGPRCSLVLDGVEGEPLYDGLAFALSPDERHIASAGQEINASAWLYIDGVKVVKTKGGILQSIAFLSDSVIRTVASGPSGVITYTYTIAKTP